MDLHWDQEKEHKILTIWSKQIWFGTFLDSALLAVLKAFLHSDTRLGRFYRRSHFSLVPQPQTSVFVEVRWKSIHYWFYWCFVKKKERCFWCSRSWLHLTLRSGLGGRKWPSRFSCSSCSSCSEVSKPSATFPCWRGCPKCELLWSNAKRCKEIQSYEERLFQLASWFFQRPKSEFEKT